MQVVAIECRLPPLREYADRWADDEEHLVIFDRTPGKPWGEKVFRRESDRGAGRCIARLNRNREPNGAQVQENPHSCGRGIATGSSQDRYSELPAPESDHR